MTGSAATKRDALWYLTMSYRYQGRMAEALVQAKEYRAATRVFNVRAPNAPRNAASPQALAEAQCCLRWGGTVRRPRCTIRYHGGRGRTSRRHSGPSRAWGMTHAASALAAAHDTVGLATRVDSVQALGNRSG